MNFYKKQHNFYCGIDLHAKNMFICIIDSYGNVKLHKNFKTSPDELLKAITPFNDNLVIAVECMFAWYWISDFCDEHNITFVHGHALYMKAIHGAKSKAMTIKSQSTETYVNIIY